MYYISVNSSPGPANPSTKFELNPSFNFWENMVLAAISFGVASNLITSAKDIIINRLNKDKNTKRLTSTIEEIAHIYDTLQQIQMSSKCDSVCLCKLSNGGNIPKVSTQTFVTILYEIVDQTAYSVKNYWQKRSVNQEISQLIKETFKDFLYVDKKENLYKDIIEAEDLEYLISIPIGNSDREFYFVLLKYRARIAFEYGYSQPKIANFIPVLAKSLLLV